MTADLVAWLTQILDEDEKRAVPICVVISGGYPAPSVPYCLGRYEWDSCGWKLEGVVIGSGEWPESWRREIHEHNLTHLTEAERFTLADIAAKRAIMAEYQHAANLLPQLRVGSQQIAWHGAGEERALLKAIKLLASAYAARPGYDESWRP